MKLNDESVNLKVFTLSIVFVLDIFSAEGSMKLLISIFALFSLPIISQATDSFPVAEKVIKELQETYSAWNAQNKKSLKFDYNLSQDTVAAYADGNPQQIKITLYGGLLKSKRVTPDGLRMMLCHEIGHNLGGSPRKDVPAEWSGETADDGLSMMSSEGQADYYATLVCFRKLVSGDQHQVDQTKVTPRLKLLCESQHKKNADRQLCLRTALAAKNMLEAAADFPISFETPDRNITPKTLRNEYPSRQCRLDTLLAGALCTKEMPLQLDFDDNTKTQCSEIAARRPSCWFDL